MKAVLVRAPMDFAVVDVPDPECPDGGLLLEVVACGLCGSDLRTLRSGHRRIALPWIIGHEVCGRVVETGRDYCGRWAVGDLLALAPPVYCGRCDFCADGRLELCEGYRELAQAWPGGMAEYMPVPREAVERGVIHAVPQGLDPVWATIAEPMSSCIHAQEKGGVGLGETVVVIGAGPVGAIHLCLARARGAGKLIIADINPDRLRLCAPFEPDHSINADALDLVEEVRRLTNGKGADVVVTANPAPVAQVQAVGMAAKGGRVLLFGGLPKDQSRPGIDMNVVHYNALTLIGTTILAPRHHLAALRLLGAGRIPADRLITHRFPLSDFARGAELALEGKALKAVFLPQHRSPAP
jgi:L-iditol 2-dehydrogenase